MINEDIVVELMKEIIKLEKEYLNGRTKIRMSKSDKIYEIKKLVEEAISKEGGNYDY